MAQLFGFTIQKALKDQGAREKTFTDYTIYLTQKKLKLELEQNLVKS